MTAPACATSASPAVAVAVSAEPEQRYRPDIGGLCAIAVLSVVACHFNIPFFGLSILRGGYVGVDIFFVLSGYLIGGNMIEQLRAGTFSMVGFYERRFRRIPWRARSRSRAALASRRPRACDAHPPPFPVDRSPPRAA